MIKLRLAKHNLHDSKFVFNLYNENVKNGFFFNKKKINFSNHHTWYESYINNKDNFFLLAILIMLNLDTFGLRKINFMKFQ